MLRITEPEQSRSFYEALGFTFSRDMDIVRDGELEATNYFYSLVLCDLMASTRPEAPTCRDQALLRPLTQLAASRAVQGS